MTKKIAKSPKWEQVWNRRFESRVDTTKIKSRQDYNKVFNREFKDMRGDKIKAREGIWKAVFAKIGFVKKHERETYVVTEYKRMPMRMFTKPQEKFLRKYRTIDKKELTSRFNKRFHQKRSYHSIRTKVRRMKQKRS